MPRHVFRAAPRPAEAPDSSLSPVIVFRRKAKDGRLEQHLAVIRVTGAPTA